MRIVKKNVYYCEHCKKRNLSASAMGLHEKHCTANLERKCRICEQRCGSSPNLKEIVAEYKSRFTIQEREQKEDDVFGSDFKYEEVVFIGEPITLKEVRDKVDNCPACILAIMRQCKFCYHYFDEYGFKDFDFKKELNSEFTERKANENSGYEAYLY